MVDCSLRTQLSLLLQLAREACLASGLSDEVGRIDDARHDFQTAREPREHESELHSSSADDTLQMTTLLLYEGCWDGRGFFLGRINRSVEGRGIDQLSSSTWKFYLLAVFCACILPFLVEFPDLSSERRGK